MKKGVKIVTIGGGSSYTPNLLKDLLNAIMNFQSENFG